MQTAEEPRDSLEYRDVRSLTVRRYEPGRVLTGFSALVYLDMSGIGLALIPTEVTTLVRLKTLLAKNNQLQDTSLPKGFGSLKALQTLNLAGNQFLTIPPPVLDLEGLRELFLGGNRIRSIPSAIARLSKLEDLYLGGNEICTVPEEISSLGNLRRLVLCANHIQSIPPELANLSNLRALSLHNNCLSFLPREILALVKLQELSLRGNPLVIRFARKAAFAAPPSLLELAGRTIHLACLVTSPGTLPPHLLSYLASARSCPNPKCSGVYFEACVRRMRFVDFCGKFRLPLMQYLCSPCCLPPPSPPSTSPSDSDSDQEPPVPAERLQKVLLG
uniref:leucine-rich repeat-containing protein 58 isoform X1 n=2 Tax=Myxine glutinosa TaxID=7769 RepID=UPI00358F039E